MLTEPDEYAGYDLPQGTVVITNIWYARTFTKLEVAADNRHPVAP